MYWHFLRVQCQLVNRCEVLVLPPYLPSAEERADPRLYADNVRALMAQHLGAKLSRYGIPEQQMIKRARYCIDWSGRRGPCLLPTGQLHAVGRALRTQLGVQAAGAARGGGRPLRPSDAGCTETGLNMPENSVTS